MAFGEGTFRARAVSLLRPGTPSFLRSFGREAHTPSPTEAAQDEKHSQNESEKGQVATSGAQTHYASGDDAVARNREAQRVVRTIPGWSSIMLHGPCIDRNVYPSLGSYHRRR